MSRFLVLLVVSPLLAVPVLRLLLFRLSIGVACLKGDFSNLTRFTTPKQFILIG